MKLIRIMHLPVLVIDLGFVPLRQMYQVGRGFGDLCKDGVWRHINVAFCSYGSPPELPEGFLERKNPFTV